MENKTIFGVILLLFSVFSCESSTTEESDFRTSASQNEREDHKIEANLSLDTGKVYSSTDVFNMAVDYQPRHLDLSKDIFPDFSVVDRIEVTDPDSFLLAAEIMLLKLDLYHTRRAHQGYNLAVMRQLNTQQIIDSFFVAYDISPDVKFISSSNVSILIKSQKSRHHDLIIPLLDSIQMEIRELEAMYKKQMLE